MTFIRIPLGKANGFTYLKIKECTLFIREVRAGINYLTFVLYLPSHKLLPFFILETVPFIHRIGKVIDPKYYKLILMRTDYAYTYA